MLKIFIWFFVVCLVQAQDNSNDNEPSNKNISPLPVTLPTNVREDVSSPTVPQDSTTETTSAPTLDDSTTPENETSLSTEETKPENEDDSITSENEDDSDTSENEDDSDTSENEDDSNTSENESSLSTEENQPENENTNADTTIQSEDTVTTSKSETTPTTENDENSESTPESTKITFKPTNEIEQALKSNKTSENETLPTPPTEENDHMECWWEDSEKLVAVILSLTILCLVFVTGCARYRGYCLCNNYEDIARRGLASSSGEYQQNDGNNAAYKNDSYDPL